LNAGTAEIKGLEWSFQWAATQYLSLGFSGNITDAEVSDVDIIPAAIFEGDRLNFVPENSYSFNADYRFDWFGSTPGSIRLDYNRQGKSSYSDRLAGVVPEVIHTESFSFININVGAQWEMLRVSLFGRNLSDEDKPTLRIIGGQEPQSRPRTVGILFDYDF
jgi:outer membrane receptor protein involved in Fe transport